jgi:acyl-CoA synthetase (AMP-forming)/AMP-acid ligase II
VFWNATSGATIVILEDPNPFLLRRHRAIELIEQERATVFPGVPFNFRLMAEAPAGGDLSSLRLCFTAGTALPRAVFDAFGERFGIPNRHDSYEALVEDPQVDAVYVGTPHPMHHEDALLALRAGKIRSRSATPAARTP